MKVLTLVVSLALVSSAASAGEPFAANELFLLRTVKQSVKTKHFDLGCELQVSPVKAIVKSQVNTLKEDYPEVYDAANTYAEEPGVRERLDGKTTDQIKDELVKNGLPQDDADKLTDDEVDQAKEVVKILADPEDAIAFSLEPYAGLNLELVNITGHVPVAGFMAESQTQFVLGNVNLDARFGHTLKLPPLATFGISYGLGLYLPTGSKRADNLVLGNILNGPKYLHEYTSVAPYVVLGLDLYPFMVQAHGELVSMFPTRGEEDRNSLWTRYGGGASLAFIDMLAISAEIILVTDLSHAPTFNGIFAAGGLHLDLFGVKAGAGAQVPIKQETQEGKEGTAIGSPSEINVIANVGFAY